MSGDDHSQDDPPPTVYVTTGLLDVLCERAREADPAAVNIALAASTVADLDADLELPAETPVLTDFYVPDAAASISRVFGIDLGVPPGQTAGRFISHPTGELELMQRDDLAGRVLIAVPPWTTDHVVAFDRRGRRHPLVTVDAAPPPGSLTSGE